MRRTRTALCVGLGLLFVAMWASAECPSVQGGLTDILGLALVLLAAIYGAIFAPTMQLWRSGVTGKNHRGRNLKPGPARAEGEVRKKCDPSEEFSYEKPHVKAVRVVLPR